MTIDKRKIVLGMDNTSKQNSTLINTIISTLRSYGFTIQSIGVGPNQTTNWVHNKKGYNSHDTILVFVCNGIDAGVIEECTYNYGYNKCTEFPNGHDKRWWGGGGFFAPSKNNSYCLALFHGAADFYNENGKYYKWLVRAHDDNYSPKSFTGVAYPRKRLEDHGIKIAFEPTDYSGEKIALAIAKQYGYGDETTTTITTTTTSEVVTETSTDVSETSTESDVNNQQTLTIDNTKWNSVLSCKTNEFGAFIGSLNLPYAGEYLVNCYYTGNSKYAPCQNQITIQNRSGLPYVEPEKTVIVLGGTSSTSITTSTTSTITGKVDPQNQRIPLLMNSKNQQVPDVSHMTMNGKEVNMATKTQYTITDESLKETFTRDSKCLQLNDYYDSQYTMFKSDEKYYVVSRSRWNAVEEAFYYYMVGTRGRDYPSSMIIDFENDCINIGSKKVNFKLSNVNYPVCADGQNYGRSCGPTSCSVSTQVLHNYHSEQYIVKHFHGGSISGSAPSQHIGYFNKINMKGELYSGKDKAIIHLKSRRPVIIHRHDHYICGTYWNNETNKVLIANSATSDEYGVPDSRWHSFDEFSLFGSGVLVSLNWTISSDESSKLNNWYESMGGKWERPATNEAIRRNK